jgi:hypothetical protein
MNEKPVKKSPVFPADTRWDAPVDPLLYESEITAMIRKMREDPQIKEDQEWAWKRWRSGDNAIKND